MAPVPAPAIKKTRLFCLAFALSACLGKAAAADGFYDVPKGHWAEAAVLKLYGDGYIAPDSNGRFNLEESVTAAEFTRSVAAMTGGASENYLKEHALNGGSALTRGEMALVCQSAFGLPPPAEGAEKYAAQIRDFIDAPERFKAALLACYVNGVIVGAEGVVRPEARAARAEAFVVLCKCKYPGLRSAPPGDESLFYAISLPEAVKRAMYGVTFSDASLVSYDDLRYINVAHLGYDGETHSGELIMHKSVAGEILEIFKILYDSGFPIEKIHLPDLYGGSDDLSMADNNTSGFNDRPIDASRRSYHQFGLAIDINPLQNPYYYVPAKTVSPKEGAAYLDRAKNVKGYITPEGICVKTFKERGWRWGGDWINEKDYQHFDKTTVIDIKTYAGK